MKEIDWEKLIKYFDGSASESERSEIEHWLKYDPLAKGEIERIKRIWHVDANNLPKPDVNIALNTVLDKIKMQDRRAQLFDIRKPSLASKIISASLSSNWMRAAALILIIIGAFFIIRYSGNDGSMEMQMVSFSKIDSLTLDDGTKVIFDSGSSFSYPKYFNGSKREVKLKGEAYFSVAKNPDAPFIVHAENGIVRVLGTKFNIRAWEKEKKVTVAVEEGKVSFSPDMNEKTIHEVLLTRGRMSQLDNNGIITSPEEIDLSQLKSWMNREIYFVDAPLHDVIDQLKRWYEIDIQTSNINQDEKITVYIQNRPFEENIKVISAVLEASYKIDGNKVVISSP